MRRSALWLAAGSALSLSACSPIGMAVGAGATGANMALQERGFANGVKDNEIWIDINARMLRENARLYQNVNLQVHEGRVLLSGFVQRPEDKVEAKRIAWETDGVREIADEMKIGRSLDLGDYSEDIFLIQRVNLKLLVDRDIRANNYSVDCIRSTIYLTGVARDQAELDRVIDHARDVPYVRAVVSHVRLRGTALAPMPERAPLPRRPASEKPARDRK